MKIAPAKPSLERSEKIKNMIIRALGVRLRDIPVSTQGERLTIAIRVLGFFPISAMTPENKANLLEKMEKQFNIQISEGILAKSKDPDFAKSQIDPEIKEENPVISSNLENEPQKKSEISRSWNGEIKILEGLENKNRVLAKVSGALGFLGKFDILEIGNRMAGILRNSEFFERLTAQNPEGNYKMTISEVLTALSSEIIQNILGEQIGEIWKNAAGNSEIFATGIKRFFENLQVKNGPNPNFASIETLVNKSFEKSSNRNIEDFLLNLTSHLILKNLFNN